MIKSGQAMRCLSSLIERQAKEDSGVGHTHLEEEKALPILKKMETVAIQSQVLPKSSIGKAVNYSLNLWDTDGLHRKR